jgi:hypothetical protein
MVEQPSNDPEFKGLNPATDGRGKKTITKALAYYNRARVTSVKDFIVQAPRYIPFSHLTLFKRVMGCVKCRNETKYICFFTTLFETISCGIYTIWKYAEAVFLVVCDPSVNEL